MAKHPKPDSRPSACVGTYAGGVPRLFRRLLAPVLSALLATAVAVPVTWYVTSRSAAETAAEATPTPSRPANRNELRAQLLAQLPDPETDGAVLLEMERDRDVTTGLPPRRYRIHLICSLMQFPAGAAEAYRIYLRTARQSWTIELPCPSTALSPEEELDFTGLPAGGVVAGLEYGDAPPMGLVLLVRFVPVTG
jgi:hypothetical protein